MSKLFTSSKNKIFQLESDPPVGGDLCYPGSWYDHRDGR